MEALGQIDRRIVRLGSGRVGTVVVPVGGTDNPIVRLSFPDPETLSTCVDILAEHEMQR